MLAAACAETEESPQGDAAVDRRGAPAADVQGSEVGRECVAPDPVRLNASAADVLIVFDASESMGIDLSWTNATPVRILVAGFSVGATDPRAKPRPLSDV